ncbi:hypothetical protein WEN_01415 [Mycoplasma wenyonii str. Massachusetts]|uniref:Uncharacterized protein n=1 Tax=Mycoplasma wenyonii (strain Massachusetts) TaxID=1197325 RepID=I6Z674_MYCWM|nr:hypothetical protein [Mycoplasma wenyonii]AFN65078.1 hypothetical protein WEN_01415 [Mycoplasma wenyonii str. Massachusetts]
MLFPLFKTLVTGIFPFVATATVSALVIPYSLKQQNNKLTNQEGSNAPAEGSRVATPSTQLQKDNQFDNCLDRNLKVKVQNSRGEEKIILLTERGSAEYPSSEWTVKEAIYTSGQCNRAV